MNDEITNFSDNFNFDKDADCVHKQLATYLTDIPSVTYPDGYHSTYKQGINMRRTGYLLTMTDEYKELINLDKLIENNFDDRALMRLKTSFHVTTKGKE